MEKKELTSGIVEVDGIKTVAERTVEKEHVTYKPYRNYHKGLTVEQVVYDLMIIAAYDQLKVGQAVFKGDYTAAEMAGKEGWLHQFMEGEDYKTIGIKTETFCCSYHAGEAFAQMAEWEGVMSLAPKKYHRFAVEGKEMPKDVKLKPYTRCHGYKPRTISLAAENDRIAKKFEVIGKMAQSLTSEGMRRALSVIAAAKMWQDADWRIRDIAEQAMRHKLWKDYGREKYSQPVSYSAKDFNEGPEIWKQVDREYAAELVTWFEKLLADYPKPTWVPWNEKKREGGYVQFKNQEGVVKKWQGKLWVGGLEPRLWQYLNECRIDWHVYCVGKKKANIYPKATELEPWTEPDRPSKKKAVSKKEKTTAKATNPEPCTVNPEPTLEERLRAALLKQLRMAA